jgi:ABC-type uncharacterized transport system substrate-binding protein
MEGTFDKGGEIVDVNAPDNDEGHTASRAYQPIKKADGSKFRIAYIDIDPYNPTFRLLYYAIESLKADGWISYTELPYDPEKDVDSQGLINWLIDNAESEYIEFVREANYYTYFNPELEAEIKESLISLATSEPGIDVIVAMGTGPSALAKELNLNIPILMYGVADPVGSGLIESVEDSGNDYIWAHVDPSVYSRQLQYYYDTFHFSNVGVIYDDEIIASVPDYRSVAETNGFTLTEYQLTKTAEDEAYYQNVEKICRRMVEEDKVDAFVLMTSVLSDPVRAKEIFQVFYDENIPVFAQVDIRFVQDGACLMVVEPRDAVGLGPVFSNIFGSVLNGTKPRDLEQEAISSPYLILNLNVADLIDYKPTYEMLIACEKIICED